MHRPFRLLVLALLATCLSCSPSALQVQAHVANGVALASNDLLPTLTRLYQAEGLAAIQAAPSRDAANAALDQVRTRWVRVWGHDSSGQACRGAAADAPEVCIDGGWRALRSADDAWATALEQQIAGKPLDLPLVIHLGDDLHAAYCGLRSAVPDGVHLPDPPAALSCTAAGNGSSGGAAQ